VLLVTQIRLYADGISRALDELDAIGRVAVEPTCATALAHLRDDPMDVVVLDLAGIDDMPAAKAFAQAAAPAPVVALAVRARDQDVVAWAERGAMGIVTQQASFDDMLNAILSAACGECDCSPKVAAALLRRVAEQATARSRVAPHSALTVREREIAALLVEGLSNKEIATRLLLGVSTVKNHVHNVLAKVDARTRTEAVALLVAKKDPGPPRAGSGSHRRLTA
jgi:DNA-binding NarL/FixJ family response regulator